MTDIICPACTKRRHTRCWDKGKHFRCVCECSLWRIAERVCNEVMGEGEYERINGFSPKKGQFHK